MALLEEKINPFENGKYKQKRNARNNKDKVPNRGEMSEFEKVGPGFPI